MWFVEGFGFDAGVGPKPLVQGLTGVRKSGKESRQRSERHTWPEALRRICRCPFLDGAWPSHLKEGAGARLNEIVARL